MQLMSARASGPTSVLDRSFSAPTKTAPVRAGDSAAPPVSPLQALPPAPAPSGGTTKKQP
jgi:hypothetical protein